jgi:hypothetical protein
MRLCAFYRYAALLAACLMPLSNAVAQPASEASFASEAEKWVPTYFQVTPLSPENGAAKFGTFARGGIQSIYTSEVIGHSPLTPERAVHTPYYDHGILAGFATGPNHDYRNNYLDPGKQQLYQGYLPLMVTTWEDKSTTPALQYEELTFVRIMDEKIETVTGGENAAAMMGLKVTNPGPGDTTAQVRLVVNGSHNSQTRGFPNLIYRGALKVEGNRAVTAAGGTRITWKGPQGAEIKPHLQAEVPQIIEFGPKFPDGAERPAAALEPPFTRYSATKGDESHAAYKAFDDLFRSYWTPETPISEGSFGVGLKFPQKRQVRSVVVTFDTTAVPPADGYRLEGFDGEKWVPIAQHVNGKTVEELKNHPEITAEIGTNWLLAFDQTVEVQGLRFMIDKLPAGQDRPAIAEFDYSYATETSESGEPVWTDTNTDTTSNYVDFTFPLAAGKSEMIYVNLPFTPANAEQTAWLEQADFEKERDRVAAHWQKWHDQGMRIDVPETYPMNVWRANLNHMATTAARDPQTGLVITLTALGWYEGVWASLSASEAIALDERGMHADAANYLEPFLQWQGTMRPPGEYETQEGFLSSPDPYTWVRWVSNHGFLMWALADHYRMSNDRAWLDRALPNLLKAVDWVAHERSRTMKDNADGTRPPHWGLLPPGATGDGAPHCYGFMGDAVTWRGLDATAAVLEDIGHARAAEVRAAADEYKRCILTGAEWAMANTPKYTMKSTGEEIPFMANDIYNVWKINTGHENPNINYHIWFLDVGPLHLVDLGVVDPRSDMAKYMLMAAEDRWMGGNVSMAEPYYNPQRQIYLGQDDIPGFLLMYYTLLVDGMDRQTYVTGEYRHGQQNLPWGDAEQSRTQRMMLVRESETGGIDYATATPRAWLEDGKQIGFSDASTYYGETSLSIESQAAQGTIKATITPPNRKAVPLRLRLRHPQGKAIESATINGKAAEADAIEGEWITLPQGTKGEIKVVAKY